MAGKQRQNQRQRQNHRKNQNQRPAQRQNQRQISRQRQQKPEKNRFSIRMQKKLLVLFIAVLLLFIGLTVRLVWITRENGTEYQKQVLSQQGYESTTIPYRRGDIVDAKGTKLATSEKVYNLVIDAAVMLYDEKKEQRYLEPTLEALGRHFDLDIAKIRQYVVEHPKSSWYVPLRRLSYEQISGFVEEQQADKSMIRGVWFEEEYKRIYPYGSLAADAIGFTTTDGQGSYGLEEYYDETLRGINGREYGYLNDDLTLERTVKAAVDGANVHTTIDANVQMMVEKYLNQFMEENRDGYKEGNGAENIGCIMMWVNTGEILAMASTPGYDLNDTRNPQALLGSPMVEQITNANGYFEIRKNGQVINQAVLDAMDEEQLYLNLNNLWKNYCITSTYEPGSTIKPFTAAAALEKGIISPNATYECGGFFEVGGYQIKCHNPTEGALTLEQAVAKSCNVAFMKIGLQIGAEEFCEYQKIFNFGLRTNIDLAGESRTDSLIYTADNMGPTDLATNAFGQNFNVSMIQMITGFCSLINGGYYYEPHMVDKITNASGATIQNIEPRVLKQTISESTSAYIRQYCEAVVRDGTGKTARPAGYMIGGKTGTGETIDQNTHKRSEDDHVVSFMGYAPVDDPQIAIYVVVDRPNVEKQSNARYATGIVRNILSEALPYLNIFMTEELSEEEIRELQERQLEITTQYTKTPEGDALAGEDGTTDPDTTDPSGQTGTDGASPDGTQPDGTGTGNGDSVGMKYPIDPESGYRVDPETGDKYDPDEGFLVEPGSALDIPVGSVIQ